MHAWGVLGLVVTAGELVAGDVIDVLGERLTVTGPPRLDRTTAVVPAVAAHDGVTVYLRAAGNVALVRPSPARRAAARPAAIGSPTTLTAPRLSVPPATVPVTAAG